MAQNIKINGVTYNSVNSLQVPKASGGTASFPDTSDATATAGDIASGKTAYVGGSKITGTATGGGDLQYADGVAWGDDSYDSVRGLDFEPLYIFLKSDYSGQGGWAFSGPSGSWYSAYISMLTIYSDGFACNFRPGNKESVFWYAFGV